jgi:hypothetical protein
MKKVVKVLLWIGGSLGLFAGTQLLGLALFGPAMVSGSIPEEPGVQLIMGQMLAISGGWKRDLAGGAAAILLCLFCQKLLRQLRQSESDDLAQNILVQVRDGKPPAKPYFLYLRAFETTKRLKAPLFLLDLATFGLNRLWTGELESFLSGALRPAGPLIALGHPKEHFGAGRAITSEEAWMDDISKLAARARGILLIPSHRPGTLWEIEHLQREGLLSRTVFIMPPESRRFSWMAHWSQARRAMGELGAALPEYEELGMVFTMDTAKGIRGVEPFSLFFMRSLRRSILRLLDQREPLVSTDKAIWKARRRAGRWRLFGRMNVLVRAAALAIFVLMVVLGGSAAGPHPEKLPWSEFWNEFMNSAEIQEREQSIAGYFDDSQPYRELAKTLTAEQESALRAEMMHAGFRRLDDQQLRTAYLAFSQLLERSNVETCGAIANDALPADQLERALWKVDQQLVTNWLDMNREAAIAELDEKPFPAVSYQALVEARKQFEASLKPEELSRYRTLSTTHGARKSANDECWMARKSYGAVGTLPEPHNLAWARLLEFQRERPVAHGLIKSPFEKLKTLPAFQQRAQGMKDDQVSDLFGDLVGKGTARLDDSTLLTRFAALGEVLARADDATCEAISQGTASSEQFETALGQISEAGQAGFLDSQYRAAVAELKQIKPVLLSKQDAEAAALQVGQALSAQDVSQVQAGSAHRCWMAKRAYAAVTELKEPYNRMWARFLNQQ